MIKYPYSRPALTESDKAAAMRVLDRQYLTQGEELPRFEAAFSVRLDDAETVACTNGTAALHLAYMAADLGPDRGLVTTAVTFAATANAARMLGATVAFADVDPVTGLVTPETLEAALAGASFQVGAASVVHLGGRACDMPALRQVTDDFGCALIEDACHAPGGAYLDEQGAPSAIGACLHSDAATFSFHAVKHLSTGEGGAVTTRRADWADRIRLLRNHHIERDPTRMVEPPADDSPWFYEITDLGFNYRMPEIECALATSQLARLDDMLAVRRDLAHRYRERLAGQNAITCPAPEEEPDQHAWHLFAVAIDFEALGKTRGRIMRALAERGIGTQVHYIPLHLQPFYQTGVPALPGAERYYARTLSLPMHNALTPEDVDFIAAEVAGVIGDAGESA
jgi:dTDP-4-amino-4,6-dideoxygalactose transaminase